jgi:hypothetical protein
MKRDDFLDRLTGQWELRGNMGPTPLHQAVNCHWALGGQFVEMRFRELRGEPYEAAYFVGRDDLTATYVLILADSTGVYPDPTAVAGIGKREGYSVNFKFGVSPHIFTNRFEWHEADGAWSHTLNSIGSDGHVHRFADKRLTRAPRSQR